MKAINFLSVALTQGARLSLKEVVQIEDFYSEDIFASLDAEKKFCDEHNIRCYPPPEIGELEDSRFFSLLKTGNVFEEAVEDALRQGECHTVEFKTSSFLDVQRLEKQPDANPQELISRYVEHEIAKTLTAFLNADGGVLLIGVKGDHAIYGIDIEFDFLKGSKKDKDAWELRLAAKLESCLLEYRELIGHVQQGFVSRDQKQVCVMIVIPRKDRIAACLCPDLKNEISYQRAGNRSNKLTPHAIEAIVRQRLSSRGT